MRLKAFKVKMYRPIIDSGWVDVDGVTVIVGKNESGKSALLKALHKFKSFSPEPYTLDREWPRGHRRERSTDAVVVQTRFDFEDGESDQFPVGKSRRASRYLRPIRVSIRISFSQAIWTTLSR